MARKLSFQSYNLEGELFRFLVERPTAPSPRLSRITSNVFIFLPPQVERVLAATALDYPDRYPEVLGALYHAFWAEKKGVQVPEVHYPILASVVGEDTANRILERVSHPFFPSELEP